MTHVCYCVHVDRVFGMAGRSSSWAIGTQLNFTGQGTEIQLSPEGLVLERLWSHRKVACHHRYVHCLLNFRHINQQQHNNKLLLLLNSKFIENEPESS